jgi:hypothetical protein
MVAQRMPLAVRDPGLACASCLGEALTENPADRGARHRHADRALAHTQTRPMMAAPMTKLSAMAEKP